MTGSGTAILLRRGVSGEHHWLLVCFFANEGLQYVMMRRPGARRPAFPVPDLFEIGEYSYQRKGEVPPSFLREYQSLQTFPEIARSLTALHCASSLCRFYERNLVHMEFFSEAWNTLVNGLQALAWRPQPLATYLKCLYRFARAEGYPVRQQWLGEWSQPQRAELEQVLHLPLDQCRCDEARLQSFLLSFNAWLARETAILPADPLAGSL